MAKNGTLANNGMLIKVLGVIGCGTVLTVIVLGVKLVNAYGKQSHQVGDNGVKIARTEEKLDDKVFPVLEKHTIALVQCEADREDVDDDIAGLESDIDKLGAKVDRFRDDIIREQKAGFREILDRMPP